MTSRGGGTVEGSWEARTTGRRERRERGRRGRSMVGVEDDEYGQFVRPSSLLLLVGNQVESKLKYGMGLENFYPSWAWLYILLSSTPNHSFSLDPSSLILQHLQQARIPPPLQPQLSSSATHGTQANFNTPSCPLHRRSHDPRVQVQLNSHGVSCRNSIQKYCTDVVFLRGSASAALRACCGYDGSRNDFPAQSVTREVDWS